MNQHLSVKEAAKFAGKSESTIKRLLREITKEEKHSDRDLILPSHEEVKKRREAGGTLCLEDRSGFADETVSSSRRCSGRI